MSIEAMKQALEALDCINSPLHMTELRSVGRAITALRAAIESQERVMKLRQDIAHHLALADGINAELAMQRLTDVQQETGATSQESRQVEPVAYVTGYSKGYAIVEPVDPCLLMCVGMALYRAPRKWVGLTDEEIEDCWDGYLSDYQLQMIRSMEAMLKEKNT
jgi:hypothetical protein